MRTGLSKRVLLPVFFCLAFAAILYVSRPHFDHLPQVGRNLKSQTPDGMDAALEKEALDQVAESADMTFPLFDYTYDKIATLSTERRRSKDPCIDVLLPNGGTDARPGDSQRVLITGGAGFIGSNLVDRLLQLGYRIRIFDNLYTGFLRNVPLDHPDVEFFLGDILNHTALDLAMKDIDYVFHLAAMSKVVPSLKDPDMARFCTEANALGSWNVLDSVRNQGHVKKVVYAASSTYYGNRLPPHSEDMAADFLTPYAASKFEGEIQMQMFDRLFGVPTVSTRFFMVYGPRQPSTGAYAIVTGVFAKQAADSKPLTIEGDGTHYRDFIHVRDIVEGLIISQQMIDLRGETINLGSGTAWSVNDVANLISSNQIHVDPRPNDLEGTLADTCKMKRLLNYRATADFKKEMGFMAQETMNGNVFMQPWLKPVLALSAPHLLAPGSPVFKWPTDAADLDALLLAMKHVERSTLAEDAPESSRVSVITFSSKEEHAEERKDVLLNTVFSLVRFGEVRQYMVAAVDEDALQACLSLNLPCYDARAQSVPGLLKALTSRGKDVHVARFGNSYIGPVQKWVTKLKEQHKDADVFGATPQGDAFVIANDRARAALNAWATQRVPELHEAGAVETLYNIGKWPSKDLTKKTFEVERFCKNARPGSKHPDFQQPQSTSFSYAATAMNANSIPSTATEEGAAASATGSLFDKTEPQSLAELEAMSSDADKDTEDTEDKEDTQRRKAKRDDDEQLEQLSPAEEECTRAFYRAIGCAQAAPLPSPPQLIANLKAADAWHLTACSDRKHCDRQQVVPQRWVRGSPDLAPAGGICA
jgi:nucleoside-diphosphate-sugar epimerase